MLISVLLSQIFGLYLVLMAILLVVKQSQIKKMVEHINADSEAIFFTSLLSCLVGLALVTVHTYWVLNWRMMITVLAWTILIKSLLWLFNPKLMAALAKKMYLGKGYYVMVFISIILGLFLLYHGYSFMSGKEQVIIKIA